MGLAGGIQGVTEIDGQACQEPQAQAPPGWGRHGEHEAEADEAPARLTNLLRGQRQGRGRVGEVKRSTNTPILTPTPEIMKMPAPLIWATPMTTRSRRVRLRLKPREGSSVSRPGFRGRRCRVTRALKEEI